MNLTFNQAFAWKLDQFISIFMQDFTWKSSSAYLILVGVLSFGGIVRAVLNAIPQLHSQTCCACTMFIASLQVQIRLIKCYLLTAIFPQNKKGVKPTPSQQLQMNLSVPAGTSMFCSLIVPAWLFTALLAVEITSMCQIAYRSFLLQRSMPEFGDHAWGHLQIGY